jgi:hypothetical protein
MASETNIEYHNGIKFWQEAQGDLTVKGAEGFLTDPNKSKRNAKEHKAVSAGTGDDAGHLIARKFGGPDLPCNFTRQNYKQNRGGGTYYDAETEWSSLLAKGEQVWVQVKAKTREGGIDRTFYREVQWKSRAKGGKFTVGTPVYYLNSESDKSRAAAGIVPKQYEKDADVIPIGRRS